MPDPRLEATIAYAMKARELAEVMDRRAALDARYAEILAEMAEMETSLPTQGLDQIKADLVAEAAVMGIVVADVVVP